MQRGSALFHKIRFVQTKLRKVADLARRLLQVRDRSAEDVREAERKEVALLFLVERCEEVCDYYERFILMFCAKFGRNSAFHCRCTQRPTTDDHVAEADRDHGDDVEGAARRLKYLARVCGEVAFMQRSRKHSSSVELRQILEAESDGVDEEVRGSGAQRQKKKEEVSVSSSQFVESSARDGVSRVQTVQYARDGQHTNSLTSRWQLHHLALLLNHPSEHLLEHLLQTNPQGRAGLLGVAQKLRFLQSALEWERRRAEELQAIAFAVNLSSSSQHGDVLYDHRTSSAMHRCDNNRSANDSRARHHTDTDSARLKIFPPNSSTSPRSSTSSALEFKPQIAVFSATSSDLIHKYFVSNLLVNYLFHLLMRTSSNTPAPPPLHLLQHPLDASVILEAQLHACDDLDIPGARPDSAVHHDDEDTAGSHAPSTPYTLAHALHANPSVLHLLDRHSVSAAITTCLLLNLHLLAPRHLLFCPHTLVVTGLRIDCDAQHAQLLHLSASPPRHLLLHSPFVTQPSDSHHGRTQHLPVAPINVLCCLAPLMTEEVHEEVAAVLRGGGRGGAVALVSALLTHVHEHLKQLSASFSTSLALGGLGDVVSVQLLTQRMHLFAAHLDPSSSTSSAARERAKRCTHDDLLQLLNPALHLFYLQQRSHPIFSRLLHFPPPTTSLSTSSLSALGLEDADQLPALVYFATSLHFLGPAFEEVVKEVDDEVQAANLSYKPATIHPSEHHLFGRASFYTSSHTPFYTSSEAHYLGSRSRDLLSRGFCDSSSETSSKASSLFFLDPPADTTSASSSASSSPSFADAASCIAHTQAALLCSLRLKEVSEEALRDIALQHMHLPSWTFHLEDAEEVYEEVRAITALLSSCLDDLSPDTVSRVRCVTMRCTGGATHAQRILEILSDDETVVRFTSLGTSLGTSVESEEVQCRQVFVAYLKAEDKYADKDDQVLHTSNTPFTPPRTLPRTPPQTPPQTPPPSTVQRYLRHSPQRTSHTPSRTTSNTTSNTALKTASPLLSSLKRAAEHVKHRRADEALSNHALDAQSRWITLAARTSFSSTVPSRERGGVRGRDRGRENEGVREEVVRCLKSALQIDRKYLRANDAHFQHLQLHVQRTRLHLLEHLLTRLLVELPRNSVKGETTNIRVGKAHIVFVLRQCLLHPSLSTLLRRLLSTSYFPHLLVHLLSLSDATSFLHFLVLHPQFAERYEEVFQEVAHRRPAALLVALPLPLVEHQRQLQLRVLRVCETLFALKKFDLFCGLARSFNQHLRHQTVTQALYDSSAIESEEVRDDVLVLEREASKGTSALLRTSETHPLAQLLLHLLDLFPPPPSSTSSVCDCHTPSTWSLLLEERTSSHTSLLSLQVQVQDATSTSTSVLPLLQAMLLEEAHLLQPQLATSAHSKFKLHLLRRTSSLYLQLLRKEVLALRLSAEEVRRQVTLQCMLVTSCLQVREGVAEQVQRTFPNCLALHQIKTSLQLQRRVAARHHRDSQVPQDDF